MILALLAIVGITAHMLRDAYRSGRKQSARRRQLQREHRRPVPIAITDPRHPLHPIGGPPR